MIDGDISNEVPRRILVTWDYLTKTKVVPRKVLGVAVGVKEVKVADAAILSDLGRLASKLDARFELVAIGHDDDEAQEMLDSLDRKYWHPFNYSSGYYTAYDFVSELPYRSDVLGVIDIPERAAGYGSYGINTDYLARAI